MGSLVVKLDAPTMGKLKGRHHYLDVDMLSYLGTTTNVSSEGTRVVSEVPVVHDV